MKEFDDIQTEDQAGCPKRLWVMLTLSDDELVVEEESLPKGLRFHLSRCSSCRALADRLMAVSTGLRDLAQLEPAEEVAIAANGQLRQALQEGATLTGDVKASAIRVEGRVQGNLEAKTKIQLTASARLEGDVQTQRLEVAEGAVLVGRCTVGLDAKSRGSTIKSATQSTHAIPTARGKTSEPVAAGARR